MDDHPAGCQEAGPQGDKADTGRDQKDIEIVTKQGGAEMELTLAQRIKVRDPAVYQLLSFHNADGDKIGWLDWRNGELTFGGDMAGSARQFFEVLKPLIETYFETA